MAALCQSYTHRPSSRSIDPNFSGQVTGQLSDPSPGLRSTLSHPVTIIFSCDATCGTERWGGGMPAFELVSEFQPTGDQPEAIKSLVEGIERGFKHQTLLGVTGSGKTFTIANVIQQVQRPTLVLAHNKTLAAQLYAEFKEFFPNNAVEYFVSYYDYYQPEAYVPSKDLFIEKDASINDEIDRLRLAATSALFSHRDVIIVASVSCIYGL